MYHFVIVEFYTPTTTHENAN